MAAIPEALSSLIQKKVNANMAAIGYAGPLAQKNPRYFIEFCTAIGTGIASGSPVISLKSSDVGVGGAPPVPGIGAGVGVIVDSAWFDENLYTTIRGLVASTFGRTAHDPWVPAKNNSGAYLHAVTKGVAESVEEHFKTAYTLQGVHPLVYQGVGKVSKGMYSGLDASKIEGLIKSNGPSLKGSFWPQIAKGIAQVYVQAIHSQSTGTLVISGLCVPGKTQVCGIPQTGFGVGTAV